MNKTHIYRTLDALAYERLKEILKDKDFVIRNECLFQNLDPLPIILMTDECGNDIALTPCGPPCWLGMRDAESGKRIGELAAGSNPDETDFMHLMLQSRILNEIKNLPVDENGGLVEDYETKTKFRDEEMTVIAKPKGTPRTELVARYLHYFRFNGLDAVENDPDIASCLETPAENSV